MVKIKSRWLTRIDRAVWFNIILTLILLSNLYDASGSGDISGLDFFFALIYGTAAILYPLIWLHVPKWGSIPSHSFYRKRVLLGTFFFLTGTICGAILLFSPTMSSLSHFFVVIFFPIYLIVTGPHILLLWYHYRRFDEGASAE